MCIFPMNDFLRDVRIKSVTVGHKKGVYIGLMAQLVENFYIIVFNK